METLKGRRIDDYVVEAEIARQPLSTVYRAIQPSVHRSVALKVFHVRGDEARREKYLRRFMRDAQIIATLEHIRIVPVYDYGIVDDASAYVVMRLLRGSLDEQLDSAPLPYAEAVDIFLQVAAGLAYGHSRNVLHGDLKPENILLDEFGNAYLADFGLGRLEELAFDGADPTDPINEAVYNAPETLNGQPGDARADQFSLAAVLYHLLTGQPPFALAAPQDGPRPDPPPIRQVNPTVPAEVESVVMRGLNADPEQRFSSVHAMSTALSIASGRSLTTSAELRLVDAAGPARSRVRAWRGLLALPLIVLLMIGMIALVVAQGTGSRAATVIAGSRGTTADAQASAQDVERARAKLGDHGFIAFVACTMDSQTGQGWAKYLKENAEAAGLRFRIYDSKMDRYQQLTQLEKAQLDGASALVVCALDTGVLDNSLAAIQKAGLPLVYTAPYEPSFGGVMLDTDHYALGAKAGDFAGQIVNNEEGGRGNVVILTYPASGSASERARGILEEVQKVAPGARIVGTYNATTPDLAAKAISTLLSQGEHIDVICTVTDSAAGGAINALRAAGVPGDSVAIVSINGEAQALDLIRSGDYLRASVGVDLATGSKLAINAIVRLLAGSNVPETLTYAPGELFTRDSLAAETTPG